MQMKINEKLKNSPQWVPHDGVFLFLCGRLWYRDIFLESICVICHVSVCIGWDGVDGHTSNYVTCVRVWCMVVSMGRGVGDGKVISKW